MKKALISGLAAVMLMFVMGAPSAEAYGGYYNPSGGGWYLAGSQGNDVPPGSIWSGGQFFSSTDTYRYPQQSYGGYGSNYYPQQYQQYQQYVPQNYGYAPGNNYGSPMVNVSPYINGGYNGGGYTSGYGGYGGGYYGGSNGWYL